jgi:glutathione synthase/RimK-type ligase-like ATP-grasp enzyme
MKVALVTCSTLPEWEKDDRPLARAFEALGVGVVEPAWDDAAFSFGAVDAALLRTTWDYVPRKDAFVAWARATSRATRLFNGADVVAWNLDKSYLAELAARGAPVAPTDRVEAGDADGLVRRLRERKWPRAFLKPVVGASAIDTLRFDVDRAGVEAAVAHVRARASAAFLLQPYFDSVERRGETSLVYFDGVLSHAVVKTPPPGDYRVQDDYGATDAPHRPDEAEIEVARRALSAVPFDGPLLYARVDLLRDADDRPTLVELELVEPSLFFRHDAAAAPRLAKALRARLLGSS